MIDCMSYLVHTVIMCHYLSVINHLHRRMFSCNDFLKTYFMRLLMYVVEIIYGKSKLQKSKYQSFYYFSLLPGTLCLKVVQTHTHTSHQKEAGMYCSIFISETILCIYYCFGWCGKFEVVSIRMFSFLWGKGNGKIVYRSLSDSISVV